MTQLVITKEYIDSLTLEQALTLHVDSLSSSDRSSFLLISYVLANTTVPLIQTRAEAEEFLSKLSVARKVFVLLHNDAGENKFATLKTYIRDDNTVAFSKFTKKQLRKGAEFREQRIAFLQTQARTSEIDAELQQLKSEQKLLDAQEVNTSTNQDSSKSRGIISFLIGIIFGFLLLWFIFKEIVPLLLNP